MARKIKFRTWDTENQEFAEWTNRDPFFSTSHEQIFFWERVQREDGSYDGDMVLQDTKGRFILQQWTGLVDKNGQEIYEGDILKDVHGKNLGVVEWISRADGYDWSGWSSTKADYADHWELAEVIGNIFETKTFN